MPILQEYEISGEFSWKSRLKAAFFSHARTLLIAGVLGFIGLIVLIANKEKFNQSISSTVIAASNSWGLLLIIIFLGYGVVTIPRLFWNAGNVHRKLKILYIKAAIFDEEINMASESLNKSIKNVCAAQKKLPKFTDLDKNLDEIMKICPESLSQHYQNKTTSKDFKSGVVTQETLVKLHSDLKRSLFQYKRSKFEMNSLILETINLEDILASENSESKSINFALNPMERIHFKRIREISEWYWHLILKPYLCKFVAVLLACLSLLIIIGEATLYVDFPLGVFPLMFQKNFDIISSQLLCLIPLSYIIICTYYGMFQIKLPGFYGMYPKATEPSNLIYCAFYLARLSAPLAYNFFLFVKVKNTIFFEIIALVDLASIFEKKFAVFFPLLLIPFSFLTYVHTYGRILNFLGMNQVSYVDESQNHMVLEGKNIVRKERNSIIRNLNTLKNFEDWDLQELTYTGSKNFGSYNN